ncbi:MAG: glutamate 5-kinase [Deltaproteobacteria bacterium]|nr:glutamate 5-kinase [Deltaproteobacteria bacterium]MBW2069755.1 glutamate 5-kinase [Deltaproteobacteria bacterium]
MLTSTERQRILAEVNRVVIKVGSGVLTGSRGLDLGVINRLCDEISLLREQNRQVVIVSSGAIASGMRKVGLREWPRTIPQKQAAAAVGQSSLIQAYEEAFHHYDLKVAQVLLTSDDLTHRRRYLNARHTLQTLLDWGIIPIVNENDTVVVDEIRFGDNDNLSALIAHLTEADLLVALTDTDGLFDCDPRRNENASIIHLVRRIDRRLQQCASDTPGSVGTGGMSSKLIAARKVIAAGIPMIIANGRKRYVLKQIFDGKQIGTLFLPAKRRLPGRKQWIAHTLKPQGELVLDDGAAKALKTQGKSLLPSGIVSVTGKFGVGAPVRCLDQFGETVGIGLVNYSAAEIDLIKGKRSNLIERTLGYKHSDEVIHRDNFVLGSLLEPGDSKALAKPPA